VNGALTAVAGTPSTDSGALSAGNATTPQASTVLPATTTTQPTVTNQPVTTSSPSAGTFVYNFANSGGNVATVNPGTNLEFTWKDTTTGQTDTSAAPAVTPGETLAGPAGYVQALNASLTANGMTGATATLSAAGQITVAGPAAMTVVPANNTISQDFTANQNQYNFVTSNGAVAAVDKSSELTFTGTDSAGNPVTTTAPSFGANSSLSVAAYAQALNTSLAAIPGASATVTGTGQITITGPSNMTLASGSVTQDFTGTSIPYNFALTGIAASNSNLRITGPTIDGGSATTNLPSFTGTPETASAYALDLQNAITAAKIVGVTVTGVNSTGLLTINGPTGISTTGSIQQDVAMSTTNYNFSNSNGAVASVDPSTSLSISEAGGTPVTAPTFTSSESVSTYANALQTALTTAGIDDVTVTGSNTTGLLSITGPADLVINPGPGETTTKGVTFGGKIVQDFNATTTNYDFGTYTDPNSGLTTAGLVGATTSLKITGVDGAGTTVTTAAIAPTNPGGETVTEYATQVTDALAAKGITGVTVTANAETGQLSIVGPSSLTFSGTVSQNLLGSTTDYAFQPSATVDPTTNLVITGETSSGTTAQITAPQVSAGETVADYASALTAALTTAGIANVSVTATNGQLAITGANVSTSGNLVQGLADSTVSYDFGSSATVNPATSLTIAGPTVTGSPATAVTTAPTVTAGETVAEYAAALNQALVSAGIDTGANGVSVTATGGQLTIVGPAETLKVAGSASQDLTATTINYSFGMSGGVIATVDPKTNLTITGQTSTGTTSTTVAPTVALGETLAQYVNALTDSLTTAGIAGVTVSSTPGGQLSITGANLSTAGSVIQDPVGSANSSGTLTFNSSGNLVSPSGDLSNITFAGLSDAAAPMNMSWNLFGTAGTGLISQTDAASSQSAQDANGYAAGTYQSFSIGSSGIITASYSNGQNQSVGEIGLATVSNLQGLVDVGSTEYQTTTASGAATVGVAGTGGLGTLEGSSLEASNVNISQEFSDLIIAQRAFEANSKAVTTFDTVTQETINMIH
jgi:flagellar hook protein FlgE